MPSESHAGAEKGGPPSGGGILNSLSVVTHRGRFKVRPESAISNAQNDDDEPFSRFRFTNNSFTRLYQNTVNPIDTVVTKRQQELTEAIASVTTLEIDQQHSRWRSMMLTPADQLSETENVESSNSNEVDRKNNTNNDNKGDDVDDADDDDGDEDVSKMSWTSYRAKYSGRKNEDTDRSHNGSMILPPLKEQISNNHQKSDDAKSFKKKPANSQDDIRPQCSDDGSLSMTSSSPAPSSSSVSSRHYDDKITLATPRQSNSSGNSSSLEDDRQHRKDWAPCRFGQKMKVLHFGHIEGIAFNTASYGCTPRVVLQERFKYRARMEANNVLWFQQTSKKLLQEAKEALAEQLNVNPDHLSFVSNANTGTNSVLKSLPWVRGDYLLIFSTDYDATINACAWLRLTLAIQVEIVDLHIPCTNQELVHQIEVILIGLRQKHRLPRLVNFCHVTSKTAYVFPAAEMTRMFHNFGVTVLIDGAQAVGHVPLDLMAINADYYVGTVHKWMYSCPGVGFLYVHPSKHLLIDPLVTATPVPRESFLEKFFHNGEIDNTGYISTKTAIRFINRVCGGMGNVQRHLSTLAQQVVKLLVGMWGTRVIQIRPENYGHMPLIQLPPSIDDTPSKYDAGAMMLALWENHRMMTFIFVDEVEGVKILLIRISIQIFHELSDFEQLGRAVLDMNWRSGLTNAFDSVKALVGE